MSDTRQHVVILPYYCQDEVDRYVKIAGWLADQPRPQSEFCFLLASSPLTEPNDELYEAFSQIAPTVHYQCPTQVFGYPEGPTAMYWDCMDFVADEFAGSQGFSLWLESDMCPTRSDWIDRLSAEWFSVSPEPMMMGCYVPQIFKYRLFRKPKAILDPHINGGACYALDFSRRMPPEAREGCFDMAVYKHANRLGTVLETDQISFSTLGRVRRDLLDDAKVLLHGFMQDKDRFIESCLRPLSPQERRVSALLPIRDRLETLQRRVRVCFVRRGHRAMLENMLLTKQKLEAERRAA